MNRTDRAGIVSSLSLFTALLFALPLVATAQTEEPAQTEVVAKDSAEPAADGQEKTESEFQPAPDPDLVVSERVSDSVPEPSLTGDAEESEPIPEHAGIEEIIVTAEKRSTTLQTTPTAVTALTGAQLFDRGIYDIEQLATQVPNFQYGETFGIARITIRGVGNQGFTDPSTAFHIDGIYQNNPTAASALTFYDLAGVEVLRGPQGTLWGRNSTAGAINVSTRGPIHDFEIFGDILGGSYNQVSARGVVNVPLVEEVVATRIAGYVDKRDGYQKNLFYPGTDQDADDADNWGLRPQILIDASDSVRVTLRGMYNHQGGVGWANKVTTLVSGLPSYNGFPLPYLFSATPNPTIATDTLYTWVDPYSGLNANPSDPRQVWKDARQFQDIDTWDVNGTLEWNFALPGLGDVLFNVVGGFRKETRAQNFDVDLTEADMVVSNVTAETQDRVIDAHLRSDGDSATDWLIGFFMLDAEGSLDIDLPGGGGASHIAPGTMGRICNQASVDPPPELNVLPSPNGGVFGIPDCDAYAPTFLTLGEFNLYGNAVGGSNDTLSLAAYGNVQHRFLDDKLTVSLGLRFTYDRSRATRYSDSVTILSPGTTLLGAPVFDETNNCLLPASDPGEKEADWAAVTGDFKVDYIPVDDHMVYGSISKGYKPGYINGQAVGFGFGPLCDPPNLRDLGNANREQIWAFEFGSKNQFLDNTVQANLTGFYYRYKNFQVSDSSENTTYITNADRARIWGIEFEGIWMPIDDLTFSVVYGYLNTQYTEYVGFNFATRDPAADYSGNEMIRAPKHQATLAVEYMQSLSGYGNLIPRVQYIVSDKIYFTAANSEEEMEPWFGNLQIRMRWETIEQDVFVEGFVENLTNENVQSTRSVGSAVLGLPILGAFQPPRTWGVRIGASY